MSIFQNCMHKRIWDIQQTKSAMVQDVYGCLKCLCSHLHDATWWMLLALADPGWKSLGKSHIPDSRDRRTCLFSVMISAIIQFLHLFVEKLDPDDIHRRVIALLDCEDHAWCYTVAATSEADTLISYHNLAHMSWSVGIPKTQCNVNSPDFMYKFLNLQEKKKGIIASYI